MNIIGGFKTVLTKICYLLRLLIKFYFNGQKACPPAQLQLQSFLRRDRSFEKHEPDVLVRKKVISQD